MRCEAPGCHQGEVGVPYGHDLILGLCGECKGTGRRACDWCGEHPEDLYDVGAVVCLDCAITPGAMAATGHAGLAPGPFVLAWLPEDEGVL